LLPMMFEQVRDGGPAPAGRHLCSSRAKRDLKLRRSDIGWSMPPLRGLRLWGVRSFLQGCRSYGAWLMSLGIRRPTGTDFSNALELGTLLRPGTGALRSSNLSRSSMVN
jgi:hypothetical protein